jgi:pilus assembly protein Flp/PilA
LHGAGTFSGPLGINLSYCFLYGFTSCRAPSSLASHIKKKGIFTMMRLTQKMRRFLTSEDGPTAVEYAVMLALIIIVCLVAISSVGTNASTTFTNVGNSIAS